jgi:hypothetical protein
MRLYREAMVLKLLYERSRTDPDYVPILHAYEGIILPGPQTPKGTAKLRALKQAMGDLHRLAFDAEPLTWGKEWMRSIGILAPNPIDAALFANSWKIMYVKVATTVHQLRSVLGVQNS